MNNLTPEQQALFDKLTPLQQSVCIGILSGLNYEAAYESSGRKASSSTYARAMVTRMVSKGSVKAFLDAMRVPLVKKSIMGREEAMERLTAMARGTLEGIIQFNPEGGWSFVDSDSLTPEQMGTIAEIKDTQHGYAIKLHDPKAAIKQLAEMQGWGRPSPLDDEIKRLEIEKRKLELETLRKTDSTTMTDVLKELVGKLPG